MLGLCRARIRLNFRPSCGEPRFHTMKHEFSASIGFLLCAWYGNFESCLDLIVVDIYEALNALHLGPGHFGLLCEWRCRLRVMC
jgi:hypothetical protein